MFASGEQEIKPDVIMMYVKATVSYKTYGVVIGYESKGTHTEHTQAFFT